MGSNESWWNVGFRDGYDGRYHHQPPSQRLAGNPHDFILMDQGYTNGFRAGQEKRQHEFFEERHKKESPGSRNKDTITISVKEYDRLKEIEWMYNDLQR